MAKIVNEYGWGSLCEPKSCGYITPRVLRILDVLKAKRVCDIGSGNGALVIKIQEAGYYVIGVEYDKQGVAISQKNYQGINFYNLGVQDDPTQILSQEGRFFDVVISTEVIEHLFSPHLLPIFARQLLIGGGYLVISTPYHGYLKNLVLSLFNKWDKHHTPFWRGGHIKFWSRKTLTQLLEDNGFQVVDFYGVGRLSWLWKSMILVARTV